MQNRGGKWKIVKDDVQQLKLLVDHVPFSIQEMESCVRLGRPSTSPKARQTTINGWRIQGL
jgi:hypothetical protein